MADVRPFRGLRYSPRLGPLLSDVVCPPYDVISHERQQALEGNSPYNAVHVELPQALGGDRYAMAGQTFDQWVQEGVLVRDEDPSYYLLRHMFHQGGKAFERWGLTVCVRLEEFEHRIVLPHEETGAGAKEDRFQLIDACRANLSPILSLYRDPARRIRDAIEEIAQRPFSVSARYDGDQELAMWVVDASEIGDAVQSALRDAPLFIADGHHRYETALRYRDEMRQRNGSWAEDEAFNFVMMVLTDFSDPGLLLLPYHRSVGGMDPPTLTALRNRLLEAFQIQAFDSDPTFPQALEEAVAQRSNEVALGLLGPDGEGPYLLTLENDNIKDELRAMPGGAGLIDSEGWVLHQAVLEPVLGSLAADHVRYVHNPQEAWDGVVQGREQMAFFLKPFPMDLFQAIVPTGLRLPSKSTFFHPKLPTGLVFNPLEGPL